jgi:hypothetical protein
MFIYIHNLLYLLLKEGHIHGVIVSTLASSVVDHGFNPGSGKTKDYKIGN